MISRLHKVVSRGTILFNTVLLAWYFQNHLCRFFQLQQYKNAVKETAIEIDFSSLLFFWVTLFPISIKKKLKHNRYFVATDAKKQEVFRSA
jgi:hypothetical protein